MGKQLHHCGFPRSARQLSCPAWPCVCAAWGSGWPPLLSALRAWEKLLIQIHSRCSARPTSSWGNYQLFRSACRVALVDTPNLLWSTWARLSLNGLSRRFSLTQFDWSGLRGAHTSIYKNTSREGINSWEKVIPRGWDYQPLSLTEINQESIQIRLHNFRARHDFTLQTAKVTVSHQLHVGALTTAQGEGEASYSFTSARSW